MNPQLVWDQLLAAYKTGDWDAIEEHAHELLHWLDRGGDPPMVLNHDLDSDWHRALARAGCAHALDAMHSEWSLAQEPAS